MIVFPPWFLGTIVYGSIFAAAAGACALLTLLVRDARKKRLW